MYWANIAQGVPVGRVNIFVYPASPGILGFEMEKNIIKLKISGCVQNVLSFYL